ncbi:hypothetical protein [Bradyrhizobium sp. DOA9]|uniref:hypothetical protein n=1 Tax=Bradyrhizobium sp. DOA9 TaxID=1126627 RepID=UPI000469F6F3|nr:hypothetical protein [Bradyrhizobium sp. DOA9]GAJ35232.1 hypothetical protein BDOA9_0144330 [Bradyrhizobium sp. DOA9]
MTRKAATEVIVPTQRHRMGLRGVAYLGTIGVVMVAWIAGLVWASIAFFDWLVS